MSQAATFKLEQLHIIRTNSSRWQQRASLSGKQGKLRSMRRPSPAAAWFFAGAAGSCAAARRQIDHVLGPLVQVAWPFGGLLTGHQSCFGWATTKPNF